MVALTKSLVAANGYGCQYYLSVFGETVVFSRAVNQASFSDPIKTLTFDNPYSGIGLITDVKPDMEIIVYAGNTATVKGRLRVRGTGITSTVIPVSEFSLGRVNIADNDRLDVVRSWRIRERLPAADSSFAPDSEAYTTQHSDPAPVCNSGGHYAGWAADATAVGMLGSLSFNVDPDSGGSGAHSYTAPTGASPASSTAADPTFNLSGCAAGTHWIEHTYTDSSNSKAATQYVGIRLHDAADPPIEVTTADLSGTVEDGWNASVTVPISVALTTAPDGALCALWAVETYGATKASYGAAVASRSHMKMVGYLARDSIRKNADGETLTFDLINARAVMNLLPGFSAALETATAPATWQQAKQLTTNRAMLYRIRELTTALVTCDLQLSAPDYAYPAFYLQESVPAAQVDELADGVDAVVTCSRIGRLRVARPLACLDSPSRAAATVMLTLDGDDGLELNMTREHRYPYHLLEGRGFVAATSPQPVFSRAPGNAPSEGAQKTAIERLIASSQADLNARTGRRYARLNSLYYGLPAPRGMRVSLRGGYDVCDPASVDEWVNLNGITTRRGVTFSNQRCQLMGVTVRYDGETGAVGVEWTLDAETDGVAGVTYVPPQDSTAITDPGFEYPPFDLGAGGLDGLYLNRGTGTIAAFNADGSVYITYTFNAAYPSWTGYALSISGTLNGFVVDAYSPLYLNTGAAVNGWVCTTTGVYRITDIFGVTGSPRACTLVYTFIDTPPANGTRTIQASFGEQNFVVVASFYNSASYKGIYVAKTVDGTSWAEVSAQTGAFYNTNAGDGIFPTLDISSRTAGKVLVGAYTATGSTTAATATVRVSLDYGATWATSSSPAATMARTVGNDFHIPFHDNPSDSILYFSKGVASQQQDMYRSDGATQTNISPGGAGYGAWVPRSFATHPLNRQRGVLAGIKTGDTQVGVFTTLNAGAASPTWTQVIADTSAASTYWKVFLAGNDQDVFYLLGIAGGIAYSQDFGVTIYDRRGDLTATGAFYNLVGG